MFKKSLLAFLALTLILVLFIPAALADDTVTQPAGQQTAEPQTTEPQTTEPQTTEPEDAYEDSEIPVRVEGISGFTDIGLGETNSVGAMALGTVGPEMYKIGLYKIARRVYINYTVYTAPATGFYTFHSLTNQVTNIAFWREGDPANADPFDYSKTAPFSMAVFLEAGESYEIWFYNRGSSSSVYFLMTMPSALGTTAYTVSPNNLSTHWLQAFDFVVPEAGDYSLHVTCPTGSKFSMSLWEGTDYHWEEVNPDTGAGYYTFNFITGANVTSELYHTFSLEPGTYHLSLSLYNKKSKTAPFTIAMDSGQSDALEMTEGTVYNPALDGNDTLTARTFTPPKRGTYRLTCDRSNAKITVISEENLGTNTYLAKNVSPDTIVYLNGDTKYYIYYASDEAGGVINYSVVYVPSVECSLLGTAPPFSLVLSNRVVTAMVANGSTTQLVDGLTLSDYATYDVLGSDGATPLDSDTMELAEGLNRAYIKVTSEDEAHTAIYPVFVYRLSASANPSILAFDSEYNELNTGAITKLNVNVMMLGQSGFVPAVTRNGSAFAWNGSAGFTQPGVYIVNVTDGNGNSASTFTFTIDRTAPSITARDSGNVAIPNNGLSGRSVTVTVSDANPGTKEAARDGSPIEWPSDNTFTEHGVYTITARDAAGNSSAFKFMIDKQPPVISAAFGATLVADNGFVNGRVVVSVTDPNLKSKSVKKNGRSMRWPSKSRFTSAGKYVVTAKDKAGNVSTFTFIIDKTKPVITAKYLNKYKLKSGNYSRYDLTVSVHDAYFDRKEVTRDGAVYTWPADNKFFEDGRYELKAYDKAGNMTPFTFIIDKTLPEIAAFTNGTDPVADKACLSSDVTVSSVSDTNLYVTYVKKNGKSMKWPSGGVFTLSGSYAVIAYDRAGNAKTFSFIIDKVNPVISVKTTTGSNVPSGGTTKYDVYVNIIDLNPDTKTITLDDIPIAWPTTNKFTLEGEYIVNATDKAGNVATEYTFTIYKPARFTVTEKNSGDPVVNNGYANDEEVTIDFYESLYSSKTLTKKGSSEPIPWPDDPKPITVKGEGVYTATVRDTHGSVSTFTFTIDTTFPDIAVYTPSSGTKVSDYFFCNSSYVTVKTADIYLALRAASKDGKNIKWPYKDRFTSEGSYIITAIDKAGNTSRFHFIIDRSKPVITCRTVTAQKSIANNGITNDSAVITVTDRLGMTNTLTKDGADITWPADGIVTEDGVYRITSKDALGYTNMFTFTIDK